MPSPGQRMGEKRQFVSEISAGDMIDDDFSIREKTTVTKYRSGYKFGLIVTDQTGEMDLTFWGPGNETAVRQKCDSLKEGTIVHILGSASEYKGRLCANVNPEKGNEVFAISAGEYDIADFMPCTKKDQEEMFSRMNEHIDRLGNEDLKALLRTIFDDEKFCVRFKNAPASVYWHCNWIGGLLEHTLNVLEICDSISILYPKLDRDLLLTSAILHDIGKVEEYTITTNIGVSADGALMGHLVIGAEMVGRVCDRLPDFPDNLRRKVIHMILASHGKQEHGSPTEPKIPEAVALSFADEMDAKLEQYIIAKEKGGSEDILVRDHKLNNWIYLR